LKGFGASEVFSKFVAGASTIFGVFDIFVFSQKKSVPGGTLGIIKRTNWSLTFTT
jgi:hypothetical protein